MKPFGTPYQSQLIQDYLDLPNEDEAESPLIQEPFNGKEISEIHQCEQLDDDLLSDSKAYVDMIDRKYETQRTQRKSYSHIKKPKSQIFSSSEPIQQILSPQSSKNLFHQSSSKRFSTPEKKKRFKNFDTKQEKTSPSWFAYFNQIPKDKTIQIKQIFKKCSEAIKQFIQNQREAFNLKQIREDCQMIAENIAQEQQYRKKFLRYRKIESLNKQSLSFRDDEDEMKNYLCQKLHKLQEKVVRIGQMDKKVYSKSILDYQKQNQQKNAFMKKDSFSATQYYKNIQQKHSTDRGNLKFQSSRSKEKLKEKTLLKDMKTIFSYNTLSQDSMLFSGKNDFRSQTLPDKLQQILTSEISQSQEPLKTKYAQKMKNFMKQKEKKTVRQKINDCFESKKILLQMVSDRLKQPLQTNTMEQKEYSQENQGSTESGPKNFLGNRKPVKIDTVSLKYRSSILNMSQVKKLNLIPENCQVLYFMKDSEVKNYFFEEQKQLSLSSLNRKACPDVKNSGMFFSNRPNRPIEHGSLNLPNKNGQKSANRVDRDFSPAKINKMAVSAMVPNKAPYDQSPDREQEKDTYNDENWGNSFKSSQFQEKNPRGNIYRSSNIGIVRKTENASYSHMVPKKMNKKELYMEAYEMYKPQGPIDFLEFYQRGIVQKCNEYVEQKLGKNKRKPFTTNFCHLKLQNQLEDQRKLQNNKFSMHYNEPVQGSGEEDPEYEMRLNHLMSLWTQPRKDLINQSHDSEQQNQEIKKHLNLGPYKVINENMNVRNSSQLSGFLKSCQQEGSSPLQEWLKDFEDSQKNFQKEAKKLLLKPHDTTVDDIFNQIKKDSSKKAPSPPNKTLDPSRPKVIRDPKKTHKSSDMKVQLKKAISEQENEDQAQQKPSSDQKLPTFKIPSNDHISQQEGQNSEQKDPIVPLNPFRKSNQTISQNTIKSGQTSSNSQISSLNLDNSSRKQVGIGGTILHVAKGSLPSSSQSSSSSLPTFNFKIENTVPPTQNQSSKFQEKKETKLEEKKETKLEEKKETKLEEKKETKLEEKKETKPEESKNIFERQKNQLQKNIFKQNQNILPKAGFGQVSNIFGTQQNSSLNINPFTANNQLNPPQYPSFSAPQFASFNPQEFNSFQGQQGLKTFTNFPSQGQQDNSFQQISQQLGQQFSGNFESFGPEALKSQGSGGFGSNIFNSGNQNQPAFSSTNPFNIMQQANAISNLLQQPGPGVIPSQLQLRK